MHFNALAVAVTIALISSASATAIDITGENTQLQPLTGAGLTCQDWGIVPNTATLSAQCKQNNGAFRSTTIPISNCVANDNGNLDCRGGGGAGSSCVFFNLQGSLGNANVLVSAHCTRADQSSNTVTNFGIGNCLSNNNGVLGC